jgi:hypothetical protein
MKRPIQIWDGAAPHKTWEHAGNTPTLRDDLWLPPEMVREIEVYRHVNLMTTQSEAVFHLIRLGLNAAKERK